MTSWGHAARCQAYCSPLRPKAGKHPCWHPMRPSVQQAGRFLPCPTPDHWQLRNQARPRHSFPERPLSTERPLKGDPDGREARANLMKPNTEGCWLFDVISRWFLKYCLFPSLFGEGFHFAYFFFGLKPPTRN